MERNIYKIGKELFITSDEEIKEGDWVIDDEQDIFQVLEINYTQGVLRSDGFTYVIDVCKKIILTTDLELQKDGVQPIDDEFLEWFIQNPSCEFVEFVYGLFNPMGRQVDPNNLGQNHSKCIWKYKIITTKEEPKQELSIRLQNSLTQFNLSIEEALELEYWKLKNIGFGKKSIIEINSLKHKQETLEEAAERYKSIGLDGVFKEGVKWQQVRMYSEEEVKKLIKIIKWYDENSDVRPNYHKQEDGLTMWEYFEQFKKK